MGFAILNTQERSTKVNLPRYYIAM